MKILPWHEFKWPKPKRVDEEEIELLLKQKKEINEIKRKYEKEEKNNEERSYEYESEFQEIARKHFEHRKHRILSERIGPDIISVKDDTTYITELKKDVRAPSLYSVVGELMLRQHAERKSRIKTVYQAGFPYKYKEDFPEDLIEFLLRHKIDVIFIN